MKYLIVNYVLVIAIKTIINFDSYFEYYLSLRDRIFIKLQAKIVWLKYVFEEKKTGFH